MGAKIFQKPRSHLKTLGACWVTRRNFHTEFTQISGANVQNFLGPEDLASRIFTPLCLGFQLFSFEELPSANLCVHSWYVVTAVEETSLNRAGVTKIFQRPRSRLKVLDACWVIRRNFHTEFTQISGANVQNFLDPEDLASGIFTPLWSGFQLFCFEELPLANLCVHSWYVVTAVEETSLNRAGVTLCIQIRAQ